MGSGHADILIMSVIPEEHQAVLQFFPDFQRIPGKRNSRNIYDLHIGEVNCRSNGSYKVLIGTVGRAGKGQTAAAISWIAGRYHPHTIILVGIAGGFEKDGLTYGDVVISEAIHDYEYGKISSAGFEIRPTRTYQTDPGLYNSALIFAQKQQPWRSLAHTPKILYGTVASGDKVIDNRGDPFFSAVISKFGRIIAVEMEGAGGAEAGLQLASIGTGVSLIMVRGISDMPPLPPTDPAKQTHLRDTWKVPAASAAAQFVANWIAHGLPAGPKPKKTTRKRSPPLDAPLPPRLDSGAPIVSDSETVHTLLRARDYQHRSEFDELVQWWRHACQPHGGGVCALVGIGGAGKTAIVERFLRILPTNPPLFAHSTNVNIDPTLGTPGRMFVFSFYEVPNADTFLLNLWSWLRNSPRTENERTPTYDEIRRQLRASGEVLLVLDGLEKLQEDGSRGTRFGRISDGRLRELVLGVAEGRIPGARLIITTRFPLFDELKQRAEHYKYINIEKLTRATAIQLLRARGVSQGTDEQLDALVNEHGCHALSVDLLGGLISHYYSGDPKLLPSLAFFSGTPTAGQLFDPREEDLLEQNRKFTRIAARYRELLATHDLAALIVLEYICIFRLEVSESLLERVLSLSKRESTRAATTGGGLQASLELLTLMRLIEKTGQERYSVHPAVRDGFLRGLTQSATQDSNRMARAGLMASLTDKPGSEHPTNPDTLDLLEEIIHHTMESAEPREAWEIFQTRMGGFEHLGRRLAAYERAARIYRSIASGEPNEKGPPQSLSILNQRTFELGRAECYIALGRLEDALYCQKRLAKLNTTRIQESENHDLLAQICILSGRLSDALHSIESALATSRHDYGRHTESLGLLAHVQALRGRDLAAQDAVHGVRSRRSLVDPIFKSRQRYAARFLAKHGRKSESDDLMKLARDSNVQTWGDDSPAIRFLQLDEIEVGSNFTDSPKLATIEAVREWAVIHDTKELLCWTGELLGRIYVIQLENGSRPLATESFAELHELLTDEIERSITCGFGLYHIDLRIIRAKLFLIYGLVEPALEDALVAGMDGIKGVGEAPSLLAARNPLVNYTQGISGTGIVIAQALLLRVAQQLSIDVLDGASIISKEHQNLINAARAELITAARLCVQLQYERGIECQRQLADLDAGRLTKYPLAPLVPFEAPTTGLAQTYLQERALLPTKERSSSIPLPKPVTLRPGKGITIRAILIRALSGKHGGLTFEELLSHIDGLDLKPHKFTPGGLLRRLKMDAKFQNVGGRWRLRPD
jgi:nucleoside phosphorylase/tetratricopeptide (TPR) repeat protein